MASKTLLQATAIGLLLCAGAGTADTVYKWRDQNGKWHFSDSPPAEGAAEATKTQVESVNTTSTATTNKELRELFADELPEEAAHRRQQQDDPRRAELEAWCTQARDRLRIIRGRVVFLDPAGNPVKVSEDEREQRARDLQRRIDRTCP